MKVVRLTASYKDILAFDGPDPVTGLVMIYVNARDVPVGSFVDVVVKDIPAKAAADLGADAVRDVFNATDRIEFAATLRAGLRELYLDRSK